MANRVEPSAFSRDLRTESKRDIAADLFSHRKERSACVKRGWPKRFVNLFSPLWFVVVSESIEQKPLRVSKQAIETKKTECCCE